MSTRSEPGTPRRWEARPAAAPRSVFGNYAGAAKPVSGPQPELASAPPAPALEVAVPAEVERDGGERALARSFLFRFLAQALADPDPDSWRWVCSGETRDSLRASVSGLYGQGSGVAPRLEALLGALAGEPFETFQAEYIAAVGHAARGRCPLNEIEYGEAKADPLIQPHRLADLAGFYRAYGMELAPDAGERHDHLCVELEFLALLAAREAFARQHRVEVLEAHEECRRAQQLFWREHAGRWMPAALQRLADHSASVLGLLAGFARVLVDAECARLGVAPGSPDLRLRPVDEASESLCASCDVHREQPAIRHGASVG